MRSTFIIALELTVAQTARYIANRYAENHLILWPWRRFSGPFLGRKARKPALILRISLRKRHFLGRQSSHSAQAEADQIMGPKPDEELAGALVAITALVLVVGPTRIVAVRTRFA